MTAYSCPSDWCEDDSFPSVEDLHDHLSNEHDWTISKAAIIPGNNSPTGGPTFTRCNWCGHSNPLDLDRCNHCGQDPHAKREAW